MNSHSLVYIYFHMSFRAFLKKGLRREDPVSTGLGLVTVKNKDVQQLTDVQLYAETCLDVSIWSMDVNKSGILCGCDDGSIYLLSSELTQIQVFTSAHKGPVISVTWHLDGIHFISVGLDRCVKVWSLSSISSRHSNTPILSVPHSCAVTAACFDPRAVSIDDTSPSSVWLFSTGTDGRLRAWRGPLLDQYESVASQGSSDCQPSALAARLDGSAALIALGGGSGSLSILRFADGQFSLKATRKCKNRSGKHSDGERIVSVSWAGSDELLVSTHDDRIRLLRYREREIIPIGKFKGHANHNKSPLSAYLVKQDETGKGNYSDESYLMSGSECGSVFIWRRDATGMGTEGEVDTGISCESFIAVEKPDKLTACVPAPWEIEKIDSLARLPACSVVATLQGVVRIFYNRGSPISSLTPR
jgi:WD40 repeat protein